MRRLIVIPVLIALVVVASIWYAIFGNRSRPNAATDVIVPHGATSGDVATLLAGRKVISGPMVFRILARVRGVDRDLEAGEYVFPPHQTVDQILQELLIGRARVATWVTIPEGFTAVQIADALADHKLGAESAYQTYFEHQTIVLGGVRTKSLEGYLFPSTYLFPLAASPEQAASILVDQFRKELPGDAEQQARRLGYTLPQVVTVASLVEREAKADDERPLIAGVIYNRLRKGMPLQVDASLEYAFPNHHTEITSADLRTDSPYNTYLHVGLPPTPIANPGLPSLLGALHPARTDYYYYVYKGHGHHAFARTLGEHNANVERYLH
ncbi:MAG TPA: endolytic transglycosylase MltG [Candidatus Acidoferrales bacterium]|nr:endolytic transglycosylase MltG [Candidatus Acidoferrales bacterium]